MLVIEKWKVWLALLVTIFSIVYSVPSLIPLFGSDKKISFLPDSKVNLGLDLRGGSHLLFEADTEKFMQEQSDNLLEDIKARLRTEKLAYKSASSQNHVLLLQVEADEGEQAEDIISGIDAGLIVKNDNGRITVSYSDKMLRDKKMKLLEQSIEIVRRRVDETGTAEPMIQRQGESRILLQVPGLQDPAHLKELVGKTAKMTFHMVAASSEVAGASPTNPPPGAMYALFSEHGQDKGRGIFIKRRALISGESLVDAHASFDNAGRPAVAFRFDSIGARKFAEITRENVGKPFAIVLDGKVISAPNINEPILGGSGIITGMDDVAGANDLALLLRAGALPVPLNVVEERTVGPSLGADSIKAGKFASALSLALVMIFMVLYYSLFGLFSCLALTVNLFLIMSFMAIIGATLTLPGIAGVILSLGMAVDANVLIYERIKEEVRAGRSIFAAVDSGFKRVFITICDSHITTMCAAVIMFAVGAGTVKGFAVTLAIGIASSLFTATLLNRILVYYWMRKTRPVRLPI